MSAVEIKVSYTMSDGTKEILSFENEKDRIFFEDDNEDLIVKIEVHDI